MTTEKTRRNPNGESPWIEEIQALEGEIQNLEKALQENEENIRELRSKENPAKNITFAREIFDSQQEKLRLTVEIDMRRKKMHRIRMENDPPSLF